MSPEDICLLKVSSTTFWPNKSQSPCSELLSLRTLENCCCFFPICLPYKKSDFFFLFFYTSIHLTLPNLSVRNQGIWDLLTCSKQPLQLLDSLWCAFNVRILFPLEKHHPVMKCFRTVSIIPYSGSQTRLSRSSWKSFPSVHKPRMKTLTKPHTDLPQLIRVSITILEGMLDKNCLPKVSWLSEHPKSVCIWLQAQYNELSDSLRKWRELRGSQLSTPLQSLEGLWWPEAGLGIAEPSSRVHWVFFP